MDFAAWPYRLRQDRAVEVSLRAYAVAADPMGTRSLVVVSGSERIVKASGTKLIVRPITRPAPGQNSLTWDELERFAAWIRTWK